MPSQLRDEGAEGAGEPRSRTTEAWLKGISGQMTRPPRSATSRAKWDDAYRRKWGIKNGAAEPLPSEKTARISAPSTPSAPEMTWLLVTM